MFRWIILFASFPLFASIEDRVASMSLEEKVGALFVIPICPKRGEDHRQDVEHLMRDHHVRAVIPKASIRGEFSEMLSWIETLIQEKPLCLMDAEWGLSMRMEGEIPFPKNLTLGAIQDHQLIEEMGYLVAKTMRSLGADINLAPVVDVNLNPDNPIIHMRSFGSSIELVGKKSIHFIHGLQKGGIYATAKHFPGHGDVAIDSHLSLPVIHKTKEELKKADLRPFEEAIHAGVSCIMSGHLFVPELDSDQPATLSKSIITTLLKEEMGFGGLVMTDALNMQAIAASYSPKEAAVKAFGAGHDLLLYGDHVTEAVDEILRYIVPEAIQGVKEAVLDGRLSLDQIDASLKKILSLKALPEEAPPKKKELLALKRKLYEAAITTLRFKPLTETKLVYHSDREDDPLREKLAHTYTFTDTANTHLYALFNLPQRPPFVLSLLEEIEERAKHSHVIVIFFGTPYLAKLFSDNVSLIIGYEKEEEAIEASFDVLIGAFLPTGRLPI